VTLAGAENLNHFPAGKWGLTEFTEFVRARLGGPPVSDELLAFLSTSLRATKSARSRRRRAEPSGIHA